LKRKLEILLVNERLSFKKAEEVEDLTSFEDARRVMARLTSNDPPLYILAGKEYSYQDIPGFLTVSFFCSCLGLDIFPGFNK